MRDSSIVADSQTYCKYKNGRVHPKLKRQVDFTGKLLLQLVPSFIKLKSLKRKHILNSLFKKIESELERSV